MANGCGEFSNKTHDDHKGVFSLEEYLSIQDVLALERLHILQLFTQEPPNIESAVHGNARGTNNNRNVENIHRPFANEERKNNVGTADDQEASSVKGFECLDGIRR